jgi:myo-inositol 2-dehydrogenase/D-chiro-inositol 1-dehydrogenase
MIRLCLIGLGFGKAVQLPAFRQLPVEVVAVGARRADKAREFALEHGIACGGSIEDVFAAKPDAVSIALPPEIGASVAQRALELGMAVLADKPLA